MPDNRIDDTLAIDGGQPITQREMNHYKGAAVIGDEEKAAVMEVLDSQSLFRYYGPDLRSKVAAFEEAFRTYVGSGYAVASTSGTAALRLALAGLGIGPGDEVIVPAVTFIASVGAVVTSRARPIFAEIDETMQLDPNDLARRLSPRTKAIMPVHLDGVAVEMDAVMAFAGEHGLTVIEDAAQSCGSLYRGKPVGTIGDVGGFSFQLEKNITSGEGGILVTDDPELYRRAVIYSDQGGQFWTSHAGVRDTVGGQPVIGENLRISEIAGAILGCQVEDSPGILDRIEVNTGAVRDAVAELDGVTPTPADPETDRHATGVLFYLPAADAATRWVEALQGEGIMAGKVYGGRPVYAAAQILNQWTIADGCRFNCTTYFPESVEYRMSMCPRTEDLLSRGVRVNVGPFYTEEDIDEVIVGVQKVANQLKG